MNPPYLLGIRTVPERLPPKDRPFPFNLHYLESLDLKFKTPITFFAGENGSGKSTLLEAIAALCRFPVSGGSRSELASHPGPEQDSPLANVLRPSFRKQPHDGFFLRAEFAAHFASMVDERGPIGLLRYGRVPFTASRTAKPSSPSSPIVSRRDSSSSTSPSPHFRPTANSHCWP